MQYTRDQYACKCQHTRKGNAHQINYALRSFNASWYMYSWYTYTYMSSRFNSDLWVSPLLLDVCALLVKILLGSPLPALSNISA